MNNRIAFLALLLTGLFLSSCGKDNAEKLTDNVWVVQSAELKDCVDSSDNETNSSFSPVPCTADISNCYYQSFAFADNGVLTIQSLATFAGSVDSDIETTTYSVSDDIVNLCSDGQCYDFDMEFNGDNLTLTSKTLIEGECLYVFVLTK